jgi:HSCB C-terminal oligomerisation domain/DnaJ domain
MRRVASLLASHRQRLAQRPSSVLRHHATTPCVSSVYSSVVAPPGVVGVPSLPRRNTASFSSVARHANEENQKQHPHEVMDDCTRKYDQDQKDAFQILGVKRQFEIDVVELKNNYRRLMNEHHPDRRQHNNNNNSRQNDDEDRASMITAAYDRLVKPHTRATHLLELLQGRPRTMHQEQEATTSSSSTNSLDETGSDLLGMDFLMTIMELREAVDNTDDEEALRKLLQDNEQRMADTSRELAMVFETVAMETTKDDKNQQHQTLLLLLDKAKQLTAHLQYWYRIQESIREKL